MLSFVIAEKEKHVNRDRTTRSTAELTGSYPRVHGGKLLLTTALALILAIGVPTMAGATANANALAPSLGAAANFAVLAGAAVTCTNATVTGNIGVFPGNAITQTTCPVIGALDGGDAAAAQAATDAALASTALAAQPCDVTLTGLGSLTLAPGVYCFDAAATETGGVLTLSGPSDGIWIFKIGTLGTLGTGALTGTGFTVALDGGAQACNVYWRVADAATLTDSVFVGTIIGGADITLTRGTYNGRIVAAAGITITGTAFTGCN